MPGGAVDGSPDKATHAQIVAAIDRELGKVGLQKLDSGPSDVLVAYDALQRTDADLKAKPTEDGVLPMYRVGTLVVRILEPGSLEPLFRARIDKPISTPRDQLGPVIDAAVAARLRRYPTKAPQK